VGPNIKGMRDAQGRPALTVNRLPQFVRQVTNEQRQSKPSVTVSPVDDGSDKKTAEVLQGTIRNIEYTSNADAAYASGGQSAATTGLGYWDVCAEYEDEKVFRPAPRHPPHQQPPLRRHGPGRKEMAGDDARWCIISTDISKGEWEALFPGTRRCPRARAGTARATLAAEWVARRACASTSTATSRRSRTSSSTLIELPPGLFVPVTAP
jgi:hypothetical protein